MSRPDAFEEWSFTDDPVVFIRAIEDAYAPHKVSSDERRTHKRRLSDGDAKIHVWDFDQGLSTPLDVERIDVSFEGVGFVSSLELVADQFVALEYQHPTMLGRSTAPPRPLRMLARVCHVQQTDTGNWRAGCEFVATMSARPS